MRELREQRRPLGEAPGFRDADAPHDRGYENLCGNLVRERQEGRAERGARDERDHLGVEVLVAVRLEEPHVGRGMRAAVPQRSSASNTWRSRLVLIQDTEQARSVALDARALAPGHENRKDSQKVHTTVRILRGFCLFFVVWISKLKGDVYCAHIKVNRLFNPSLQFYGSNAQLLRG